MKLGKPNHDIYNVEFIWFRTPLSAHILKEGKTYLYLGIIIIFYWIHT